MYRTPWFCCQGKRFVDYFVGYLIKHLIYHQTSCLNGRSGCCIWISFKFCIPIFLGFWFIKHLQHSVFRAVFWFGRFLNTTPTYSPNVIHLIAFNTYFITCKYVSGNYSAHNSILFFLQIKLKDLVFKIELKIWGNSYWIFSNKSAFREWSSCSNLSRSI